MKTKMLSIIIALLLGANVNAQSTSNLPDYFTAYLQLKDALYQGDTAKIKAAATDMKGKTGTGEVSDSKKLESIFTALTSIATATDIEVQRTAFAKLSQYMITVLENDPVPGITLYSDFCPMARAGKGAYWLSTDKEINNNPYMGTNMPHCGTIDQKISK